MFSFGSQVFPFGVDHVSDGMQKYTTVFNLTELSVLNVYQFYINTSVSFCCDILDRVAWLPPPFPYRADGADKFISNHLSKTSPLLF